MGFLPPGGCVGRDLSENRERRASKVRLNHPGGHVLLEEDPGEAHVVQHPVDAEHRPRPLHELKELIHLIEHDGLIREVKDGLEKGAI